MESPSPDDMLVAGLVLLTALVAFIAVLYLNRKSSARSKVKVELPAEGGGTKLVEEGGRVVRRSTRQHKPPASDDAFTQSPSVVKTPRATRASEAGTSTPLTGTRTPRTAERMTSPPRGRRTTAAKSPAGRRATKSPAPASTPASPPATTPRGRGRPAKAKA